MNPNWLWRHSLLVLCSFLLVACGGGGSASAPPDAVQQLAARAGRVAERAPAIDPAKFITRRQALADADVAAMPSATRALFGYGESDYWAYFPSRQADRVFSNVYYRYYPETGAYLLVDDVSRVYVFGGPFGPAVFFVGTVPELMATCQTVYTGFSVELLRQRPQDQAGTGTGDDGGVGGVGGSSAEGAVRYADVTLYDNAGTVLGTARSDVSGLVRLKACGRSGPFRIEFAGNDIAEYFDEAIGIREDSDANAWRPFRSGERLEAWVENLVDHHVAVTPLTHIAAQDVAASAGGEPGAFGTGPGRSRVLRAAAGPTKGRSTSHVTPVTLNAVRTANEGVRATFNQHFAAAGIVIDDITKAPALANGIESLRSFSNDTSGQYAQALTSLAKAAAQFDPSLTSPAREMTKQLVADLSDGVIDGKDSSGSAIDVRAYEVATFEQAVVEQAAGRLRTLSVGQGSVAVTASDRPVQTCASGVGDCYPFGAVVTLQARPLPGFAFTGWSGGCASAPTDPVCRVTMAGDKRIVGTFTGPSQQASLQVNVAGAGGRVASVPGGITCPSDCSEDFQIGTLVTLTATGSDGAIFAGWGGACSGTSPTCQVRMEEARTVSASFGTGYQVTITRLGPGTVTSSVPGTPCGSDCLSFPDGTRVALTAVPDAGYAFEGWSGQCAGTGACNLTMTGPRSVRASFVAGRALQVTKPGSGSGTVTSVPAGIDCGASCLAYYVNRTQVTLSARADAGSTFGGWSGGGCSGTGTCSVTLTADAAVQATFLARTTLTVARDGSGSGTVTSGDGVINCGSLCRGNYDGNTQVTLTAVAASGSQFIGWSGGCTGTGSCRVTMDQSKTVTATFDVLPTYTLSVAVSGPGNVSSLPGGISACTSNCSAGFLSGTSVLLSATAQPGAAFVSWSGACSGSDVCSVEMNGNKSVAAEFSSATYLLSGTVSGLPSGVSGLRLRNAGVDIDVTGGATTFTFGPVLLFGTRYAITVSRQPTGYACTVLDGSGVAPAANVTSPRVECLPAVGAWTWEGGSTVGDQAGVHGTLNIGSVNNIPGARKRAAAWTASGPNLYLFGGAGYDGNGSYGYLSDLWRFNPASRAWTWIGGPRTADGAGVYGSKGVPSAGNVPGARWGAATWIDASGRLWLHGGTGWSGLLEEGTAPLNDLWSYDPSTRQWTWVSGCDRHSCVIAATDPPPFPHARYDASTWRDGSGNLWLFGGEAGSSIFNDLWRFSPQTGVWTRVKAGSPGGVAVCASGTQTGSGCTPGVRAGAVSWTDGSGQFWLFGGYGQDAEGNFGYLSDVWRYRVSDNSWSAVQGMRLSDTYEGFVGETVPTWPGARWSASGASGADGRLWLFGGSGFGASGSSLGELGDLWAFDPVTLTFTRLSGTGVPDLAAIHGTRGVTSPTSRPGGRFGAALGAESATRLWLFGGGRFGAGACEECGVQFLNDLWRVDVPAAAPQTPARGSGRAGRR